MGRWQRYWFAEGGRGAIAIVRIALAVAVLLTLSRLARQPMLVAPASLYRPVGPWMVLGGAPPPAWLISALWVAAWGGTVTMLLGLVTRASTAISFAATVLLTAVSFSATSHWSHTYNIVMLAQLAFLGARGGDALSVDALIRRARGLPPIDRPRAYQWSLRLVQFAVAMMFAGAFFHKMLHAHGTLRWALSDNLRHHLMVRYDLAGLERPPLVDWLLAEVWRYRGAAMLNLVTQAAPIFACVFVRRPWIRLCCGLLFITEVVALDHVVMLWNPHWLPLAAVFVDWDAAGAALARRWGRAPAAPAVATEPADPGRPWAPPRGPRIFIACFVVYDLVTSMVPTLDQRLNTFPFSGFPMFATIRAERPYAEHRPYAVVGDHVTPVGDPVHVFAQRWLDHIFRGLHRVRDPDRLRSKLADIVARAPIHFPDVSILGVRHELAIFEAPAYPAPARFERHLIAITGELHADGTFRTVLGSLTTTPTGVTVELRPRGVDPTDVKLVYYANNRPQPIAVTGVRTGDRFELPPLPGSPLYVVAIIDDVAWLVASRR